MIAARNCFAAKPGQASKLAALFKEAAGSARVPRFRILTDLAGDFKRVALEYQGTPASSATPGSLSPARGILRVWE